VFKENSGAMVGFPPLRKLRVGISEKMVEAVGVETAFQPEFNNIQSTDGNLKYVKSSAKQSDWIANGSQGGGIED
jgi:hypothetical protein